MKKTQCPVITGTEFLLIKNIFLMDNVILEKDLLVKLNISRSTLHRYKTQLGFPFIKFGGKTFYNMQDVEAFLRKHSSNAHNNAKYAGSKF